MGIDLPDFGEPWNGIRDLVIWVGTGGGAWPRGDETQIRQLAQAWRGVERALRGALPPVQAAGDALSAQWQGKSGKGFQQNWAELGGPKLADELYQLIGLVADSTDQAALDIEYEKISTIVSLIVLMIEIFIIIIAAIITFFGAMALAAGRIALTRAAIMATFRFLVARAGMSFGRMTLSQFLKAIVLKGLPWEILREVAAELGIDVTTQATQKNMGTRQDWDYKKSGLAALGGFTGAALSPFGQLGRNFSRGVNNPAGRGLSRFVSDFGDELITESGAQFVVNGVGYGNWTVNTDNLFSNTLGGMARDRVGERAQLSNRIIDGLKNLAGLRTPSTETGAPGQPDGSGPAGESGQGSDDKQGTPGGTGGQSPGGQSPGGGGPSGPGTGSRPTGSPSGQGSPSQNPSGRADAEQSNQDSESDATSPSTGDSQNDTGPGPDDGAQSDPDEAETRPDENGPGSEETRRSDQDGMESRPDSDGQSETGTGPSSDAGPEGGRSDTAADDVHGSPPGDSELVGSPPAADDAGVGLSLGQLVAGTGAAAAMSLAQRRQRIAQLVDQRLSPLRTIDPQRANRLRAHLMHAADVLLLAGELRATDNPRQREKRLAEATPDLRAEARTLAEVPRADLPKVGDFFADAAEQVRAELTDATDPATRTELAMRLAINQLTAAFIEAHGPQTLQHPGLPSGFEAAGQRDLEALRLEVPRTDNGFELHPGPLDGFWISLLNDGGITQLGRRTNCVDATRAALSTWFGHPVVAGADIARRGESRASIEAWTGGRFHMIGGGDTAMDTIERNIRAAGPGAATVISVMWARGSGQVHMICAVNHGGTVYFIDGQNGTVIAGNPYAGQRLLGAVRTLELDAGGRPLELDRMGNPMPRQEVSPIRENDTGLPNQTPAPVSALLQQVAGLPQAQLGAAGKVIKATAHRRSNGDPIVTLQIQPEQGDLLTIEVSAGQTAPGQDAETEVSRSSPRQRLLGAAAPPHRLTLDATLDPAHLASVLAGQVGRITEELSSSRRVRDRSDLLTPGILDLEQVSRSGRPRLSPRDVGRLHEVVALATELDQAPEAHRDRIAQRMLDRARAAGLTGNDGLRRWDSVSRVLINMRLSRQVRAILDAVPAQDVRLERVSGRDIGGALRPAGDRMTEAEFARVLPGAWQAVAGALGFSGSRTMRVTIGQVPDGRLYDLAVDQAAQPVHTVVLSDRLIDLAPALADAVATIQATLAGQRDVAFAGLVGRLAVLASGPARGHSEVVNALAHLAPPGSELRQRVRRIIRHYPQTTQASFKTLLKAAPSTISMSRGPDTVVSVAARSLLEQVANGLPNGSAQRVGPDQFRVTLAGRSFAVRVEPGDQGAARAFSWDRASRSYVLRYAADLDPAELGPALVRDLMLLAGGRAYPVRGFSVSGYVRRQALAAALNAAVTLGAGLDPAQVSAVAANQRQTAAFIDLLGLREDQKGYRENRLTLSLSPATRAYLAAHGLAVDLLPQADQIALRQARSSARIRARRGLRTLGRGLTGRALARGVHQIGWSADFRRTGAHLRRAGLLGMPDLLAHRDLTEAFGARAEISDQGEAVLLGALTRYPGIANDVVSIFGFQQRNSADPVWLELANELSGLPPIARNALVAAAFRFAWDQTDHRPESVVRMMRYAIAVVQGDSAGRSWSSAVSQWVDPRNGTIRQRRLASLIARHATDRTAAAHSHLAPTRLVVTFAAGTSGDAAARAAQQQIRANPRLVGLPADLAAIHLARGNSDPIAARLLLDEALSNPDRVTAEYRLDGGIELLFWYGSRVAIVELSRSDEGFLAGVRSFAEAGVATGRVLPAAPPSRLQIPALPGSGELTHRMSQAQMTAQVAVALANAAAVLGIAPPAGLTVVRDGRRTGDAASIVVTEAGYQVLVSSRLDIDALNRVIADVAMRIHALEAGTQRERDSGVILSEPDIADAGMAAQLAVAALSLSGNGLQALIEHVGLREDQSDQVRHRAGMHARLSALFSEALADAVMAQVQQHGLASGRLPADSQELANAARKAHEANLVEQELLAALAAAGQARSMVPVRAIPGLEATGPVRHGEALQQLARTVLAEVLQRQTGVSAGQLGQAVTGRVSIGNIETEVALTVEIGQILGNSPAQFSVAHRDDGATIRVVIADHLQEGMVQLALEAAVAQARSIIDQRVTESAAAPEFLIPDPDPDLVEQAGQRAMLMRALETGDRQNAFATMLAMGLRRRGKRGRAIRARERAALGPAQWALLVPLTKNSLSNNDRDALDRARASRLGFSKQAWPHGRAIGPDLRVRTAAVDSLRNPLPRIIRGIGRILGRRPRGEVARLGTTLLRTKAPGSSRNRWRGWVVLSDGSSWYIKARSGRTRYLTKGLTSSVRPVASHPFDVGYTDWLHRMWQDVGAVPMRNGSATGQPFQAGDALGIPIIIGGQDTGFWLFVRPFRWSSSNPWAINETRSRTGGRETLTATRRWQWKPSAGPRRISVRRQVVPTESYSHAVQTSILQVMGPNIQLRYQNLPAVFYAYLNPGTITTWAKKITEADFRAVERGDVLALMKFLDLSRELADDLMNLGVHRSGPEVTRSTAFLIELSAGFFAQNPDIAWASAGTTGIGFNPENTFDYITDATQFQKYLGRKAARLVRRLRGAKQAVPPTTSPRPLSP